MYSKSYLKDLKVMSHGHPETDFNRVIFYLFIKTN